MKAEKDARDGQDLVIARGGQKQSEQVNSRTKKKKYQTSHSPR